jgi:hypothetical protein
MEQSAFNTKAMKHRVRNLNPWMRALEKNTLLAGMSGWIEAHLALPFPSPHV